MTSDDKLMKAIITKGIALQNKIEALTATPFETRTESPQILWRNFKTEIQNTVKKLHRNDNFKIRSKIDSLEKKHSS